MLTKQTLTDFQEYPGKDLIEDVLPVQQCKRTTGGGVLLVSKTGGAACKRTVMW